MSFTNQFNPIAVFNDLNGSISRVSRLSRISRLIDEPDKPDEPNNQINQIAVSQQRPPVLGCVEKALETGTVLQLWFHPSCDPVNVETVFPAVLNYLASHRSDLWVTTMAGLVDSLSFHCSAL